MEIYPLILSSLAPLHPGSGRSPGIVDLPVIKDPMGYPLIPGTMIKGSLKTRLALKHNCLSTNGKGKATTVSCTGNNNICKAICCLLGKDEPGEASRLSILDFYPIAVPVPSLEEGVAYITSPLLLARAQAILQTATNNPLREFIEKLLEEASNRKTALAGNTLLYTGDRSNELHIGLERYTITRINKLVDNSLTKTLEQLNPIYKAHNPQERMLIAGDHIASKLIERGLIRVTRIALDRKKKTVKTGALWTEEYIPHGSLFIGGIIDSGWEAGECQLQENPIDWIFKKAGNGSSITIIIGGKETVGRGLARIIRAGG
ncbi:MAG: type III-B CRISPR module RAMP protein Cmr4 [Desulfurococcales archaeon]|nr:type III-B CRISPR module RAMP protein Cmr4 [Desulfurococcales archaeon]